MAEPRTANITVTFQGDDHEVAPALTLAINAVPGVVGSSLVVNEPIVVPDNASLVAMLGASVERSLSAIEAAVGKARSRFDGGDIEGARLAFDGVQDAMLGIGTTLAAIQHANLLLQPKGD